MKFSLDFMGHDSGYLTLEAVGDQVILISPVRPLVIELGHNEWQIYFPSPEQAVEWPERLLHGGPATKEDGRDLQ